MIASIAAAAQGQDFVFELIGSLDDKSLRFLGFEGGVDQMRSALATVQQLNSLPRDQRRKLLGT